MYRSSAIRSLAGWPGLPILSFQYGKSHEGFWTWLQVTGPLVSQTLCLSKVASAGVCPQQHPLLSPPVSIRLQFAIFQRARGCDLESYGLVAKRHLTIPSTNLPFTPHGLQPYQLVISVRNRLGKCSLILTSLFNGSAYLVQLVVIITIAIHVPSTNILSGATNWCFYKPTHTLSPSHSHENEMLLFDRARLGPQ